MGSLKIAIAATFQEGVSKTKFARAGGAWAFLLRGAAAGMGSFFWIFLFFDPPYYMQI